jgi:hypothetical protein
MSATTALLRSCSGAVATTRPELVLLTGEPAAALERLALADGYDLLAATAKLPLLVAADRAA